MIQQESQRKAIEITKANADIARREKEAELAEKEIALRERKSDNRGHERVYRHRPLFPACGVCRRKDCGGFSRARM